MHKDFERWHSVKGTLHERKRKSLYFQEREVWWCSFGCNLGYEMDGKGVDFGRPAVILKKFNDYACLALPLTSRARTGKYYFPVGVVDGTNAVAVLSQIRFVDGKRLSNKIGTIEKSVFERLITALVEKNFSPAG